MASFDLWIEAEEWEAGTWDTQDSVTDVIVTLADGSRWVAGFCTYQHVDTLRGSCEESGECLGGKYLWASDLILIDSTSRESIEAVVADLIAKDELTSAFSEIIEDEEDDEEECGSGHVH